MKNKVIHIVYISILFMSLCLGVVIGYTLVIHKDDEKITTADPQILLSANTDYSIQDQLIICPTSNMKIYIHHLDDLLIEINGCQIMLEEAIRQNTISAEQLFSMAVSDSKNGRCTEQYISEKGLTQFIFRYASFQLTFIHDIYETPDGKQHLISSLDISEPGGLDTLHRAYYDEATHLPLDREDWGLTFEEPQATATGLTLPYSHTGGQQIGKLQAESYQIFLEETKEPVQPLNSDDAGTLLDPGQFLTLNAGGEIVVDWTKSHGNLPSGTYILRLTIQDVYEESQCHPLMRNYHDIQTYEIIFKII